MTERKGKSIIKRVYIPTYVRDLPNGEKGNHPRPLQDATLLTLST